MSKPEKVIFEFIEKHMLEIGYILAVFSAIVLRISLRGACSADASIFLKDWYYEIIDNGGLWALKKQVGDYNLIYQFFIAIFTYLPIKWLYAYKIFSVIFDFALALLLIRFIDLFDDVTKKSERKLLIFSMTLLLPTVVLNSSWWAQCDVIYTFFSMFALLLFLKEKYNFTFIVYGVALAFKLQAIFLLPFFLIVYVIERKYSIIKLLWIPIVMIVVNLPAFILGRNILDLFRIYINQTSTYPVVSDCYPSFWNICFGGTNVEIDPIVLSTLTLATIIILAILTYVCLFLKIDITSVESKLLLALIFVFSSVLFLPEMHQRYGFLYEIIALVIVVINRKTLRFFAGLILLSMVTYGQYMTGCKINFVVLSVINIAVYIGYLSFWIKLVYKNEK